MRRDWRRTGPDWRPTQADIRQLVRPVAGKADVLVVTPVAGGLVNSNFAVTLSGPPGRVLLRLYARNGIAAHKELSLESLIGDRVPIARFLHFEDRNPITGLPYAVLAWIEGERLDVIATREPPSEFPALGAAVGAVLAEIHSFRFDKPGFFAADLTIPEAIDLDQAGLLTFLDRCLCQGPGRARLGASLTDRLFAFARREGGCLEDWPGVPCLAHADFNPTNILMLRGAEGWIVVAVLDWEFALSATPGFDFGNLLRPPLGEQFGFVAGLAQGYRAAGGSLPADWVRIARITDLFAWAEMLARPDDDPARNADARSSIAATIAAYAA